MMSRYFPRTTPTFSRLTVTTRMPQARNASPKHWSRPSQTLDRACTEEGRRKTLAESERLLAEELTRLRERRARLDTAPSLEGEATQVIPPGEKETARTERVDQGGFGG